MSNISISLSFITNAKEIQIIIPTPPPPPPPTTMIIQQYNVPTIVYRASSNVVYRQSTRIILCIQQSTIRIVPSFPCSFDGIGGVGISTTTIRRWVYDRRHITAIVGGGEMYHTSAQSLNNTQINANTTINRAAHTNCRAAAPVMPSTSQRR